MIYLLKMVIFHSYIKLPEGTFVTRVFLVSLDTSTTAPTRQRHACAACLLGASRRGDGINDAGGSTNVDIMVEWCKLMLNGGSTGSNQCSKHFADQLDGYIYIYVYLYIYMHMFEVDLRYLSL